MNPDEVLRVRTAAYKAYRITGCVAARKTAVFSIITRKPPYRQIVNLDTLLSILVKRRKLKLQCEYLELLPFGRQVRLFSQTDIVMGMHGAGFSNIVFMCCRNFQSILSKRLLSEYGEEFLVILCIYQ